MTHADIRTLLRAAGVGLLVLALSIPGHSALNAGRPLTHKPNRVREWTEDIDRLAIELPRLHKDLFHQRTEAEFRADIQELKDALENLNDSEIIFSLARIIAACGDAHTMLGYRPQKAFPLSFYWFQEGIYCIASTAEFGRARDCRLLEIEHRPIDEVVKVLSRAIPYENPSQLKKSVAGYLVFSEMLHGSGITSDPGRAVYTLENITGDRFEVTCTAVPFSRQMRPEPNPRPMPLPLNLEMKGKAYSFTYLKKESALYLAYNACRPMKEKPFADFVKEVFTTVDLNPVDRFVIDLRHNGGGNSALFEPLIAELTRREDLNRPSRLFVIIGRGTFSSAVLNAIQLKNRTSAVFVGEPSGGKPNHFGEVKTFMLKNCGLPVSYSTKYFTLWKIGGDALYPDIPVELTIRDYLNNRDPVLDRILKSDAPAR